MTLPMFKIIQVRYSNNPCDFCYNATEDIFSPGITRTCKQKLLPYKVGGRQNPCPKFIAHFLRPQEERERLTKAFRQKNISIMRGKDGRETNIQVYSDHNRESRETPEKE